MIFYQGFGSITVEIKLIEPIKCTQLLSSIARIQHNINSGFLRAVNARYEN